MADDLEIPELTCESFVITRLKADNGGNGEDANWAGYCNRLTLLLALVALVQYFMFHSREHTAIMVFCVQTITT